MAFHILYLIILTTTLQVKHNHPKVLELGNEVQ